MISQAVPLLSWSNDVRLLKSFQGNVISTPATNGTILEGITRRSVIEIARDYGYQVTIYLHFSAYKSQKRSILTLKNFRTRNIFLLWQVEERVIPVDELINADQVFCTGTAVVVAPVGSITYQNKRYKT